jgi:hypothetical protein
MHIKLDAHHHQTCATANRITESVDARIIETSASKRASEQRLRSVGAALTTVKLAPPPIE